MTSSVHSSVFFHIQVIFVVFLISSVCLPLSHTLLGYEPQLSFQMCSKIFLSQ